MEQPAVNGRPTSRDVLEALNFVEVRITARLERMEEKFDGRMSDHDHRLTSLETSAAIESARTRGILSLLTSGRSVSLFAIAIGTFLLALVGAARAI